MNVWVLGGKRYVLLEVDECLVGVTLYLQAFGPLEVGFGIFFIKINAYREVLDGLGEIAKTCKNQSPQIEIFGYVVLALFYGLIYIGDSFAEILQVKL